MAEQLSPLAPALRPGRFGNTAARIGVTLSETAPGSIVQVVAWPGGEQAVVDAIAQTAGLTLGATPTAGAVGSRASAFTVAPGKFLVIGDEEGFDGRLNQLVPSLIGAVTDLSHGRTAIRVAGPKAEWLLSKFFAVDFSERRFPVESGVTTQHHDIFAQIQRSASDQFDLYVFRSFARSFWNSLTRAAEEIGYEVR